MDRIRRGYRGDLQSIHADAWVVHFQLAVAHVDDVQNPVDR